MVHSSGRTFGVATAEPGWYSAALCVWACQASPEAPVMWCVGAGPWDSGSAHYYVAEPTKIAGVVARHVADSEPTTESKDASNLPLQGDGWSALVALEEAGSVDLPPNVRSFPYLPSCGLRVPVHALSPACIAQEHGLPPQPLSMACCFVSGGTRAWPMVGLGDGRVVAMEASPAFGADGRSLTLVVGLVATFHVDEVPLQLSSMTVSAQVASEVRRRDPAWCGMRLCLTVRRRVWLWLWLWLWCVFPRQVLGEACGTTLPAVMATGYRRHVLLIPQSPSLSRGGSTGRPNGGSEPVDLRASRAGLGDAMGTWHVSAIVVHTAFPLVAIAPLLTSGVNHGTHRGGCGSSVVAHVPCVWRQMASLSTRLCGRSVMRSIRALTRSHLERGCWTHNGEVLSVNTEV